MRHLDGLAERGRKRKQRVYTQMHVQAGHWVLDIGCGPGTDTIPPAQLVGPTGHVTGVDLNEALLVEADKRAEQAGVGDWVEHRLGDASSLPFEGDHFDACHSERLFMHLLDPKQAFAEIVRVTKPGGWIAIIDTDWGSLSIDTSETDVERRMARFYIDLHKNGYAGRQLYRFFKQHNLVDVSVDVSAGPYTDLALVRRFGAMDERLEKAVGVGVITQDELERFRASLERADAMGAFFATVNMVTVIGRKP